ncbi:MAG TPA: DNRLRE domain-containing protein [Anaeromyxobacter sp.]|nr:DNRLRE domain-containing protein [Anaeromyxobacter sp.]
MKNATCTRFPSVLLILSFLVGCGGGSTQTTPLDSTLNPVLNFYINRTWNTDADALAGYGVDDTGTNAAGTTGSAIGTGSYNYHNVFRLLFNFDIAALSGAKIQSASFRVYLQGSTGADATHQAVLENIHYGDTDSFPADPRNYDSELEGYLVTPAISATADVTVAGWKSFDVTDKLQADIDAGRTNSQFRLGNENDDDLLTFYCYWSLAHDATNPPELVIAYVL